jgi:hypothetical protein
MKILSVFLTAMVAVVGLLPNAALPRDDDEDTSDRRSDTVCPRQLQHRSVEQVLQAHLAAFRGANAALLACDYARDATFIMPGTVVRGRDDIQATFAGFFQTAGLINQVSVASMTIEGEVVLMTYSVDSAHLLVAAGVDTFVVRHGRIVAQTVYLGGLSPR